MRVREKNQMRKLMAGSGIERESELEVPVSVAERGLPLAAVPSRQWRVPDPLGPGCQSLQAVWAVWSLELRAGVQRV